MWWSKKVLSLEVFERAVGDMSRRGVVPSRESMVAVTSVVGALGVPVTVRQEGATLASEKKAEAATAKAAVPVVQKATDAAVRELEQKIAREIATGERRVAGLEATAKSAELRAKQVEGLVNLL